MTAFILIPGSGGAAWYWSLVEPLLRAAGHDAIAVDLPADDPERGIVQYAELVVAAIGSRKDAVIVAQSMGGFTAPMVCERVPVTGVVLVNAMIPLPGETAGEWWDATGHAEARIAAATRGGYSTEFSLETYFLHDVPPDVAAEGASHQREEAEIGFAQPCEFTAWPDVPIHVAIGADDRFFPAEFQARVARERLPARATIQQLTGGHLIALSQPRALTDFLLSRAG